MIGEALLRPRRRAGVFLSICAFSFMLNYGRVAFAPLVDVFIQSGVTPAIAGLAATAVWMGSALPRLPTGYLLTFVRRHQVILVVGVWLALASAFTALSPGIWLTVTGAFAIGLSTGAFFIAANPLVSELYPRHVGLALGARGMFSQLAAVAAPLLVAITVVLGSWRLGFAALGVLSIAVTVTFAIAIRRAELPRAGVTDRDLLGGIHAEWRLVVAGIAFVGITGFVWQGVFNFYVTYLGVEKGLTPGMATSLLTLTFAAGVPSFIVGGRLADRLPFLALLLGIVGGFAACLLAVTIAQGVLAIAVVSILMGFVIHGMFPVGDAYMLSSLPDAHRASAYSGFSATMMLMQAPGSVVVGVLADLGLAYGTIFRTFAVVVGLLAAVLAVLARTNRLPRGSRSRG